MNAREQDHQILDTIDSELPVTCWTDEQRQAWNRELDRDKAEEYTQ